MYGISENIIRKIILEHTDDKVIFDKIKEQVSDYVNNGGFDTTEFVNMLKEYAKTDYVDGKIKDVEGLIDNLKSLILGDDTQLVKAYDTLSEVGQWIEAHGDEAGKLVEQVNGIEDTLESKADKKDIPSLTGYATESWSEEKFQLKGNYLTEHQSLVEYAKTSDVESKLEGYQPKGEYVNESDFNSLKSKVGELENYDDTQIKTDIKNLQDKKADRTEIPSLEGLAKVDSVSKLESDKADKSAVEEALNLLEGYVNDTFQTKGDYLTFSVNKNNDNQKVTTFDNNQILGAIPNTTQEGRVETNKTWVALIELNKWNVVDLGNPYLPTNINTPKGVRPTVQEAGQSGTDANQIAYLSDFEDYVKFEGPDMEGHGRHITMENKDMLMGKPNPDYDKITTDQAYVSIAQISKYNCVDLGNYHLPMVLSVPAEQRPVVDANGVKNYVSLLSDLDGLKNEFNEFKNFISENYELSNQGQLNELKNGGDVTLSRALDVTEPIEFIEDTNLDLNGKIVTTETTGWKNPALLFGNGEYTVSNGVIKMTEGNQPSGIYTESASNITLENVDVTAAYPVATNNKNAIITIKSGNYVSPFNGGVSVYVGPNGGKVIIEGGIFGTTENESKYVLNISDGIRYDEKSRPDYPKPIEFITVRGGEFWNFDPSNNAAEGVGTNFVAEGYKVEVEEVGEDKLYKVVSIK